jgi:hypothetical protein
LKATKIRPAYKTGYRQEASNYRPILVLSVVSKNPGKNSIQQIDILYI